MSFNEILMPRFCKNNKWAKFSMELLYFLFIEMLENILMALLEAVKVIKSDAPISSQKTLGVHQAMLLSLSYLTDHLSLIQQPSESSQKSAALSRVSWKGETLQLIMLHFNQRHMLHLQGMESLWTKAQSSML